MDPLAPVKAYREQEESGPSRALRLAPPPTIPVADSPTPDAPSAGAAHEAVSVPALDDADRLDVLDTAAEDRPPEHPDTATGRLPGTARGRKRLMQVYLPAGTRTLLERARTAHGTLGNAVMAALRGAYDHIVTHHVPEPVAAVGPFPAPRTVRRRLVVDDARMRPIYVDPEEAKGIETLADQCELSLSELVTIAIDWFYGQGGHVTERTSGPAGDSPRA